MRRLSLLLSVIGAVTVGLVSCRNGGGCAALSDEESARYVCGQVLEPSGASASRARVSAEALSGEGRYDVTADGDGEFAVGPLPPGEYRLLALFSQDHIESATVTVRPGDREVVLRLRDGAVLKARALDASSGAPRDATLIASSTAADWVSNAWTEDGGFARMRRLVPATWYVAAVADGGLIGVAREADLEDGEEREVDVELSPGARLSIAYTGAADYAVIRAYSGEACVLAENLLLGEELEAVVPAGEVRVTATFGDRQEEQTVAVVAGARAAVRLGGS